MPVGYCTLRGLVASEAPAMFGNDLALGHDPHLIGVETHGHRLPGMVGTGSNR